MSGTSPRRDAPACPDGAAVPMQATGSSGAMRMITLRHAEAGRGVVVGRSFGGQARDGLDIAGAAGSVEVESGEGTDDAA